MTGFVSRSFATSAVLFCIFFGISHFFWGGPTYGLNYMRGERLVALHPVIDLGTLAPNSEATATFRLKNLTGSAIEIYGLKPDCSCISAKDLPMTVPAYGESPLEIRLATFRHDSGKALRHHSELFLSVSQPNVILTVEAAVPSSN